ncbi:uncharacterized protein LOC121738189 isoform X2 [Aricia agestis]|uniref:uncharacterized protein LOC121738189 isoform X2 n=1 Tax=Aricia agestis TaxID=91739 RepID=UPI001C2055E8|nr:uncharacterized protein LOC121738189 isoform X2 [Aricia agestis]
MFLTITNLPPNIKVESLKKIIKEQCYVENMLVDNLKSHGKKGKSVTVGFMDKIEASVVLAKMDGYFLDGYKLTVRVVQQKTKQPEPTTSNPMVQPSTLPLKSPLPVHQFVPQFTTGAGLPSAPMFPSANAGLRPPAPVFPAPGLPPAPPLYPAVPSKQTPPETVAVAPNPVPLPPNPVAALSKNVNKTPPVKFKLTPPAEKQPSISSMPYYAIQQSASEDNLPTKNKPSQGSSREKTRRRRSRCKSRSPPERSSSSRKSRSPHRGRTLLVDGLEVSHDRSSRYDRKHDRFVDRFDHGRFDRDRFGHGRFDRDRFEHGRRSPDRQRGHFSDRGRHEDRKRQFDEQRHHRNHSYRTERFDKRKRTRSPKSDEEDFIDRKRDKRRSRPYSHERLDKRKINRSQKSEDDFIDRKHDMRRSRSNSNERLDKRKRYGSPISDDVDLIYQNLDLRRSRSCSGDREYSRERTKSPVAVRAEENVAPVIPQPYFDPSNSYGNHPNTEPTVNTSYNSHSSIDPYSLSSAVSNPCAPVDGSVPSQTYYQPPGLYPPNPYTTHPTNQASTNALYPFNSNFQVGVPFNPAIQNPTSPYPNNPFLQTRFVPTPQIVTRPNPNLQIHTNIRTRFNPPSQNRTTFVKTIPINENIQTKLAPTPKKITTNKIVSSSANTQPNSDPPPLSSTTLNDNIPSGMKTKPRSVPALQSSSTLNDNIPSGMKTQPRSVPPSQNSTTLNDNVPSSAKTQPRSVMPPQSSTTLNDNIPSSANTQPNYDQPSQNSAMLSDNVPSSEKPQPRSVPPSQNSTTLNDNVPSSANTQPDYATHFKSNRKVVDLKKTLSQTTLYTKIRWAVPNLVIKELLNLYSVDYLPNGVFKQIKEVYSNRVQEAMKPGLTGEEIFEYYKSLYPYSNEKLVLEGLIGRKLTMLKEDKPGPEPVTPYRIKFNGVDRDLVYENALDEELKALELSFLEACRPSNDPDTDKLCTLLKRKGVADFFKMFRMQILKLSYEKSVLLLRMNYNESEPSLSSLTKFLKSKNMEMISHNKKDKFILVRCETNKDFLKMQACKLIYIDDCALTIRNCKSFDTKYDFEEFLNNASSSIKIEKDDISGALDDNETQVLNMDTKHINDFKETQVLEPATPKDKEFDNTVPKESDKVNTQYFHMANTVDIKCETSMEEYDELSPSEQKNTQHAVESTTQDNAESDIPMTDSANLLLTALDNKNAQRIIESHTSNVESDTLVSNVVPTLADEVKQDKNCVEDSTSEENFVKESPAILESEIPQCNVESNKDNSECYKPLKEQNDAIIDEAKLEDTKCIKESNNAENQCDTREEDYVNKLSAEIKSEDIQCNEESNKNSYVSGKPLDESIKIFNKVEQAETQVGRPVNNLLDGIDEENAQCIKKQQEFNNKCNTETNKPAEEHNMNVPLAELESKSYSHIEESNIKRDPDKLVNVRVTELEPGNIQSIKEIQKEDPITDECVKDPSAELESENTPCVDELINTQTDKCDKLKEEYVEMSPAKLEPERTQSIESSNTQNNENCANIESDYTDDQIANTLAEIEECLQNSNFDFDNLDDYNEIGEYKEKSEIVKANEDLTTEIEDEDLEDF